VWTGPGGPATVAPLFLLYDYSFLAPGTSTPRESLDRAYQSGVVCSDEFLLRPDPYPSRDAWCRARVTQTEARLAALPEGLPLILANHYPLVRQPTRILHHQEFAQWCGTRLTADWHLRFPVRAMVYGHLHIPRTSYYDGVRFEEVSVGYPREWKRPGHPVRVAAAGGGVGGGAPAAPGCAGSSGHPRPSAVVAGVRSGAVAPAVAGVPAGVLSSQSNMYRCTVDRAP
jgi:hypothetical protein